MATSGMDVELVRFYRNRWKAVEKIEIEESRNASFEQQWQRFVGILQLARTMGLSLVPDQAEEEVVYLRWSRIKDICGV